MKRLLIPILTTAALLSACGTSMSAAEKQVLEFTDPIAEDRVREELDQWPDDDNFGKLEYRWMEQSNETGQYLVRYFVEYDTGSSTVDKAGATIDVMVNKDITKANWVNLMYLSEDFHDEFKNETAPENLEVYDSHWTPVK